MNVWKLVPWLFLEKKKSKIDVYTHGHPCDVSSVLVVCFIELKIKVNVVGHVVIGLHSYKFKMKQMKTNIHVAL